MEAGFLLLSLIVDGYFSVDESKHTPRHSVCDVAENSAQILGVAIRKILIYLFFPFEQQRIIYVA